MHMLAALASLLVLAIATTIVLAVRAINPKAAVRVGLGLAAWLAFTAALGASGVLMHFESKPPRLLVAVAAGVALFTYATRTATAKSILAQMPRSWPVGMHTMRIPIELGLWSLFLHERIPVVLTFEGRNFDVLVGITAPIIALFFAKKRAVLLAWNVGSLMLLANIVVLAVSSFPGTPIHIDWPGPVNTVVAEFPFVWLPTFLVPVALFSHVVSLRQVAAWSDAPPRSDAERDETSRAAARISSS